MKKTINENKWRDLAKQIDWTSIFEEINLNDFLAGDQFVNSLQRSLLTQTKRRKNQNETAARQNRTS